MLRNLEIRDILIIDRLEIAFQPGLNVLTGETGAGKSILLDALGFVLGWHSRAGLVREGAAQGEVTAVFDIAGAHPAREVLREADLPDEDDLVLRCTKTAEGRRSARVNDRRCSGEVLRRLADTLVELHGQQDDRGLLDGRMHRAMLDAFGGHDAERQAVAAAWDRRRALEREAADLTRTLGARPEDVAALRSRLAELEDLAPGPGEYAALREIHDRAEAVLREASGLNEALAILSEEGVADPLRTAWARIESGRAALGSAAETVLDRLAAGIDQIAEAERALAGTLEDFEFDAESHAGRAARLSDLDDAAIRNGLPREALAEALAEARTQLAAIDAARARVDALAAAEAEAEAAYDAASAALTEARRAAGIRLDAAMAAELAPLKMERAVFTTEIAEAPAGPEGRDAVAFRVATNPGAPAGPLARIASGGELSRFLLALKVCLTAGSDGLTLIFDEIDRGVGGATADAVGRRLAALAARPGAQVLVVTHSPQVAAQGAHHWRVEKHIRDGATLSTVVPLAADERVDELARMVAGDRVTAAARDAARALLDG